MVWDGRLLWVTALERYLPGLTGIRVLADHCALVAEGVDAWLTPAGTPVIAILGGMGRTRNGSYAELVTVPAGNVVRGCCAGRPCRSGAPPPRWVPPP
jgi:hypothetical protein